jgi:hypothetical protein
MVVVLFVKKEIEEGTAVEVDGSSRTHGCWMLDVSFSFVTFLLKSLLGVPFCPSRSITVAGREWELSP